MAGRNNIKDKATFPPAPDITGEAQKLFEEAARTAGYDPHDKWVGSYVEYEWTHLRPLLGVYGFNPAGLHVLEFGCNVGASSIVMAAMGGNVTAIDVDEQMIAISGANLLRHNLKDCVEIVHVTDTRAQPFADESFDLVLANSVLEYVAPDELPAILKEIHRVMKPSGRMLLCGTASRLAPREIHSGRWFVNYLPRWIDRLVDKKLQRGLSPFHLAKSLQGRFAVVPGGYWLNGRLAVHSSLSFSVRGFEWICRAIGIEPGWLAPNIELLLRKN